MRTNKSIFFGAAAALLLTVDIVAARSFGERDVPVTANEKDAQGNVDDASSTPYTNYSSAYSDPTDQRYPNGLLFSSLAPNPEDTGTLPSYSPLLQ